MTKPGSRRPRRRRAVLALAVAAALAGCSKDQQAAPRPPATASISPAPKALFTAWSLADGGQRLHELDAEDVIRQIDFRAADGSPVGVFVWDIEVLSTTWVLVSGEWDDGDPGLHPQALLLRIPDGRLFDVSSLWPFAAQLSGGSLYSVHDRIERLDLTTMTVHPMSNPAYEVAAGPFLVDRAGNVRAIARAAADPTVPSRAKIFFADNSIPLVDPWQAPLCDPGGAGGTLAEVYGEDGTLYAFCAADLPDPEGSTTNRRLDYFVREVSFTHAGTRVFDQSPIRTTRCSGPTPGAVTCPDVKVGPSPSLRPHTRARRLTFSTGFFTMSAVPGGGISLAWTDLALPDFTTVSAGHVYWRAGDVLYRLRLQAGATPETVVTDSGLISWQVAAGVVVFTKYLSGTAAGTYRVRAPGLDPELVSSSDVNVSKIVEL